MDILIISDLFSKLGSIYIDKDQDIREIFIRDPLTPYLDHLVDINLNGGDLSKFFKIKVDINPLLQLGKKSIKKSRQKRQEGFMAKMMGSQDPIAKKPNHFPKNMKQDNMAGGQPTNTSASPAVNAAGEAAKGAAEGVATAVTNKALSDPVGTAALAAKVESGDPAAAAQAMETVAPAAIQGAAGAQTSPTPMPSGDPASPTPPASNEPIKPSDPAAQAEVAKYSPIEIQSEMLDKLEAVQGANDDDDENPFFILLKNITKLLLYPLLFIFLVIYPYIYVTTKSFSKVYKLFNENVVTM